MPCFNFQASNPKVCTAADRNDSYLGEGPLTSISDFLKSNGKFKTTHLRIMSPPVNGFNVNATITMRAAIGFTMEMVWDQHYAPIYLVRIKSLRIVFLLIWKGPCYIQSDVEWLAPRILGYTKSHPWARSNQCRRAREHRWVYTHSWVPLGSWRWYRSDYWVQGSWLWL